MSFVHWCSLFIVLCSFHFSTQRIERYADTRISHFSQIVFDTSKYKLIVGTRDYLLRLSLDNFNKSVNNDWIYWPATAEAVKDCRVRGQSGELCHNYIEVLLKSKSRNDELFVCGTNAFKPECSWRKADSIGFVTQRENGLTKCPFSPNWNTTSLLTDTGNYYYGGANDFMGRDIALIRNSSTSKLLRTARVDSKWLNTDTNFITSFEDKSFVYFVFRESAVEYINCGKAIYSRIGRVCKNDNGVGSGDVWTTFVKSRLNCSIPGQFPFYFNEIQSSIFLHSEQKLYAIFSTPQNSIYGSAVCVFSMDSIKKAFSGNFKYQSSSLSSWEGVSDREARDQFECRQSSNAENDPVQTQRKYQLMDESIASYNGKPLIIETLEGFSKIAVDSAVHKSNEKVDVIFVLTKRNKLRRYALWPFSTKACFINEIVVTSRKDDVVLSMKLLKDTNSIYIGTKYELIRIPLSDCDSYLTKEDCLRSNDPYCGWNSRKGKCTTAPASRRSWTPSDEVGCSDDKNYVWSPWSDWEGCAHVMNNHDDSCLCRWQQCQGIGCPAVGRKIEVSNCTRHGGLTEWSEWGSCSASCGVGVQTRTRSCTNPSPQFGGRGCVGLTKEKRNCSIHPCPVVTTTASPENFEIKQYLWSEWGQWESCSANCGGGIQFSRRRCLSLHCIGCETRWQLCNLHPCDEVKHSTDWTKWYQVNFTSDGYGLTEERFRFSCKGMTINGSELHVTLRREDRYIDLRDSKRMWSECTVSCGGGVQFLWNGDSYLKRSCNTDVPCKGWTEWSKWSSCRGGVRYRSRECFDLNKCKAGKEIEKVICGSKTEGNSIDDDVVPDGNPISDLNGSVVDTANEVDSLQMQANAVKVAEAKTRNQLTEKHEKNTIAFSFVILFCVIALTFGSLTGAFATFYVLKRNSSESDRHQRLSLKLFNNSGKATSNAYVTANDFKANNCNNASPSSSLLPASSTFPQSSVPLLYSPAKEATIKRASTIRAKLNSDQNF